jgi:hypothetical protein
MQVGKQMSVTWSEVTGDSSETFACIATGLMQNAGTIVMTPMEFFKVILNIDILGLIVIEKSRNARQCKEERVDVTQEET